MADRRSAPAAPARPTRRVIARQQRAGSCRDRIGRRRSDDQRLRHRSPTARPDGNGRLPTGNPDVERRAIASFLGTAPRDFQARLLPPPQGGDDPGGGPDGHRRPATTARRRIDSFRRGAVGHLFYLTELVPRPALHALGFDEASGKLPAGRSSAAWARATTASSATSGLGRRPAPAPRTSRHRPTARRRAGWRCTISHGPDRSDRDGGLDAGRRPARTDARHEQPPGRATARVSNWDPAGGMGEGWSELLCAAFCSTATNADDPDGRLRRWRLRELQARERGVRRQLRLRRSALPRTATDHGVNPLTWADVDDVTNSLVGVDRAQPAQLERQRRRMEAHNAGRGLGA